MDSITYTPWLSILRSLNNSQGWTIHERDLNFNRLFAQRFNLKNYNPAHLTYLGHSNKQELEKCCKLLARKYGLEHFEIRPAKRLKFKWEAKIEGLPLAACDDLEKCGSIPQFITQESLYGIDKINNAIKLIQRENPFVNKQTIESIIANYPNPNWTIEELKQDLIAQL